MAFQIDNSSNQYCSVTGLNTTYASTTYWTLMFNYKWKQSEAGVICNILDSTDTSRFKITTNSTGGIQLNGAPTTPTVSITDSVWTTFVIKAGKPSSTSYIWLMIKAQGDSSWTYVRGTNDSTGQTGTLYCPKTISFGDIKALDRASGYFSYGRYWNAQSDTADADHRGATLIETELDAERVSPTPVKTTSGAINVIVESWKFSDSADLYNGYVNNLDMVLTGSAPGTPAGYINDEPSYVSTGGSGIVLAASRSYAQRRRA